MHPNPDEAITLVSLADERYAIALAVMGRSLCESLPRTRRVMLYVVDGGIAAETKRRLLASWDHDRLTVDVQKVVSFASVLPEPGCTGIAKDFFANESKACRAPQGPEPPNADSLPHPRSRG